VIVDFHCHAGKGDRLTGPWDIAPPLDEYIRWVAKAGINRIVIFATFHSDYAVANDEITRIVASRPGRFYGLALGRAMTFDHSIQQPAARV
jgi:hypothetical protein